MKDVESYKISCAFLKYMEGVGEIKGGVGEENMSWHNLHFFWQNGMLICKENFRVNDINVEVETGKWGTLLYWTRRNAQMVWGKRSIDLRLFLSRQQKKHAILFSCFVSGYVMFKSPQPKNKLMLIKRSEKNHKRSCAIYSLPDAFMCHLQLTWCVHAPFTAYLMRSCAISAYLMRSCAIYSLPDAFMCHLQLTWCVHVPFTAYLMRSCAIYSLPDAFMCHLQLTWCVHAPFTAYLMRSRAIYSLPDAFMCHWQLIWS